MNLVGQEFTTKCPGYGKSEFTATVTAKLNDEWYEITFKDQTTAKRKQATLQKLLRLETTDELRWKGEEYGRRLSPTSDGAVEALLLLKRGL